MDKALNGWLGVTDAVSNSVIKREDKIEN